MKQEDREGTGRIGAFIGIVLIGVLVVAALSMIFAPSPAASGDTPEDPPITVRVPEFRCDGSGNVGDWFAVGDPQLYYFNAEGLTITAYAIRGNEVLGVWSVPEGFCDPEPVEPPAPVQPEIPGGTPPVPDVLPATG